MSVMDETWGFPVRDDGEPLAYVDEWYGYGMNLEGGPSLIIAASSPKDGDLAAGIARARLASAAPDMARLLLEEEWGGWSHEFAKAGEIETDCCPWCGGSKPRNPGIGGVKEQQGHRYRCRLVEVLRKAGLR